MADKLICSQKYVQILSNIVVQIAGSPTNISQLQKEPKHQSEYIQKLSEVFQRFANSKWLLMLHAHVTPKSINIIRQYSKITGVYIQKKMVLFTTYKMSKQYIICYWSLTEKANHLKLITVLITFNLIALFIKTRHVLKTSQLNLTKGP